MVFEKDFGKKCETKLTKIEIEVLNLVARGKTNTEIAAILFVSTNTIKARLKSIFYKLQVKTRIQAALKAHYLKLIQFDDKDFK